MSMSPNTSPSFDTPGNSFPDLDSNIQSFAAPFDPSHMLSPPMPSAPFHFSIPELGDSQSPSSANFHHRMSIGSSAQPPNQLHAASIGDSDATSPVSGQDPGSVGPHTNTSIGQPGTDEQKDKDGRTPAWAELKTKAGKERKRLPLACIACRRKKIRCSGEKPACKHCLRSRIPCVYKVTTRKAAPRTDYMAMLDKRLKRMEERVIKIVPKEDQGRIGTIGRAVVKPAIPGLPSKNEKKRAADTAFGDDISDWSKSKTGGSAEARLRIGPQEQDERRLLQEGADQLPSHELQIHLAEVYFDYVYGQSYHLLHKPSFMRKLEVGQVPPVLILAVCAISARFSSHPDVKTEPAFLRGENWASAAREIALKRYDSPNITILIVYLILGLHEFGTCQGGRSWMLGGMAQRMAYALQLHKDLNHDTSTRATGNATELSFTDREIRRRTMWACFMMDRFNSSGTERPLFVNDQYIQAQLPVKEHLFQFEIPGTTEILEGPISGDVGSTGSHALSATENMGVAAYIVRLVAIWGRVIRYMNLGGRERDKEPMWSTQSEFHAIKEAVREWQSGLPTWLYWSQENLDTHASEKIANQFIFMHLICNQIICFTNRFALPSPGSKSASVRDTPQAFITESGRAALDAANLISVLVNEAMDHRVIAPFAGYCAFFSSTVHIYGVFSKNPALEASSKQNLAINIKYLTRMKKHWGMFHFVTENLKELYRKHADAAFRGAQAGNAPKSLETIFQYGDWFDRYPHGVSGTDYEEPVNADVKKEPGSDAVLGQKNDLQSVEEFFSKLSPASKTAKQKAPRKKRGKAEAQPKTTTVTAAGASGAAPGPGNPPGFQSQQQIAAPSQAQALALAQAQRQRSTATVSQMAAGSLNNNFGVLNSQHNTNFPAELAMMQQQQQSRQQPDQQQHHYNNMLSLDTSMSPYTNLDPSSNSANPFSIDLNAFDFGMNSNNTGWGDQSTAWFMPFNVDPPSAGAGTLGDDAGGLFAADSVGGFDVNSLFPDFGGAHPGLLMPEHGFEDNNNNNQE
ncbi:hypothetical protein E4T47_02478 [Aureobasidium subglaciale]|nr:hypothetical protein E4T47_02478 [Aureobasidium subglaciale]